MSAPALLQLDLRIPCDRFYVELSWRTSRRALALFGPSGAGKTTLLETIAGLRKGPQGRIEVAGRVWLDSERGIHLAPEARRVGYVPQDALLFPHLDALANLQFGARRRSLVRSSGRSSGRPSTEWPTLEQVLEVLELESLTQRSVETLSGGERQRVALGRALLSAPDLLLLDEPLASLDLGLRRRILGFLIRVQEEFRIPTIFVSHQPAEVALLAEEVVALEAGAVVAQGTPQMVFGGGRREDSPMPVTNVLKGRVVAQGESLVSVEVAAGIQVEVANDGGYALGQPVSLELRASEILIAAQSTPRISAQNLLPAVVTALHEEAPRDDSALLTVSTTWRSPQSPESHGDRSAAAVAILITRRALRELALEEGSEVFLVFKAQACRLLAR
ncbi:MAG: ATP-binding cassette domain-containing protein [Acidobacteriota bacterium]